MPKDRTTSPAGRAGGLRSTRGATATPRRKHGRMLRACAGLEGPGRRLHVWWCVSRARTQPIARLRRPWQSWAPVVAHFQRHGPRRRAARSVAHHTHNISQWPRFDADSVAPWGAARCGCAQGARSKLNGAGGPGGARWAQQREHSLRVHHWLTMASLLLHSHPTPPRPAAAMSPRVRPDPWPCAPLAATRSS